MKFMNGDKCLRTYIGQIIPRNACRSPWTNTLDGRFACSCRTSGCKAEITLDVLNLINLFDSKSGPVPVRELQRPRWSVRPTVANGGGDLRPAQHRHQRRRADARSQLTRDDLRSRWQMQLGATYPVLGSLT